MLKMGRINLQLLVLVAPLLLALAVAVAAFPTGSTVAPRPSLQQHLRRGTIPTPPPPPALTPALISSPPPPPPLSPVPPPTPAAHHHHHHRAIVALKVSSVVLFIGVVGLLYAYLCKLSRANPPTPSPSPSTSTSSSDEEAPPAIFESGESSGSSQKNRLQQRIQEVDRLLEQLKGTWA